MNLLTPQHDKQKLTLPSLKRQAYRLLAPAGRTHLHADKSDSDALSPLIERHVGEASVLLGKMGPMPACVYMHRA